MSQQLADFGWRKSLAQHVGRQSVAKLMRSLGCQFNPGAL
jgi:hypothetical protein